MRHAQFERDPSRPTTYRHHLAGWTRRVRLLAVSVALGLGVPTVHAAGIPSNFVLPPAYATYGDGNSYSLAFACSVVYGSNTTNCPYYVNSTPGNIKDLIVVATGASGQPVNTNFTGMDNAYATPNETSQAFFSTGTYADPGGAGEFNGDLANTWDSTLTALDAFLNGQDMVVFFNNNQVNSGAATNQDLAAWGRIWITDANGLVAGSVFDLTNQMSPYDFPNTGAGQGGLIGCDVPGAPATCGDPANYSAPSGAVSADGLTDTGPGGFTNSATDYVLSGGQICADAVGHVVACSDPNAVTRVNNNLGANQAAYAVVFPELNTLLGSLFSGLTPSELANYTFHADIRLGCDPGWTGTGGADDCTAKSLNNGYEQIFIGRLAANQHVPEPDTLALLGLALAGLGFARRRAFGGRLA